MAVEKKTLKVHNKSDKPDNVVENEHKIMHECAEMEKELPKFFNKYFLYLKGNVLPKTRRAYLYDVRFFCRYLVEETGITDAKTPAQITLKEFQKITADDVNYFFDYCRHYETETEKNVYYFENNNKTISRKRSSLSVLFKELNREGFLEKNITGDFTPIKVQKASEREIKALQDDEVMVMLDAVSNGTNLSKHELFYWQKTKLRDKAILILFLTYGLRLSELQQLNVSSFNFSRGEFKIYRKRNKEALMPINKSVEKVLNEYIDSERAKDENLLPEHQDALFLSLQGKRMTERQIRELVKKYTSIALNTSRSGGYSPHKLRATAATSLIGRGNSIYDVAALLDHEQVTTTQLYAAHQRDVKRNLVKNMEWELEREEGEQ
ncbi:MAG: tyrosine-type recombinase/integrase [Clostridia bacterium]|nr:tyrosine-type recombinase/integrase [Clostridia bacterium]